MGALRLVGKDVGDILTRIASDLRFNPEGRFVNFILDRASLLDDPMLRRIGFGAFCYAAIGILEGIGLYLEKAWGEYLTLIITASFLALRDHGDHAPAHHASDRPAGGQRRGAALLSKLVWERQRGQNAGRNCGIAKPEGEIFALYSPYIKVFQSARRSW